MKFSMKLSAVHALALCVAVSALQITSLLDPNNKDGFNYYKDYLRGKSHDIPEIMDVREADQDKVIYFYRTPALLHLPPLIESLPPEREFGKRTNKFKNHMLTKDLDMDGESVVQKRISKAALAWILDKKNTFTMTSNN